MTFHQIYVLYAGIVFCALSFVLFGAVKVLGPTYADRITVGWKLRGSVFTGAVVSFVRGVTLIFPGRSVHVQFVPWIVPVMATAFLLIAALATDWIVSHRAPPAVMERLQLAFQLLVSRRNSDLAAVEHLMTGSGAPPADAPHPIRFPGNKLRNAVVGACTLAIMILLAIVIRAAAAQMPA